MSFYFYDLETFGRDPRVTRIAQFAGLRTNDDLETIGEPLVLYCKPADDLLPSPEATLITGITPQHALREGTCEAQLLAQVAEEFSVPHTCVVGYNSLRFDDEFIRYGLYRSFHDPYEREWRNGNSRWDPLDMLRLAHALRPGGMAWPTRADGTPSFKLTDLSAANGISHENAHDALSDVHALIGVTRAFRRAQPKLFDYCLRLRDKRFVASLLDVVQHTPVLHVSGRYRSARHNAALVAPLCRHPQMDSRVIVFDLDADPQPLIELGVDDIADRLYTPAADLPEGVARIPLKEISVNKCPAVVAIDGLRAPDFERLRIDPELAQRRAQALREAEGLAEKVRQVYARDRGDKRAADADAALYDGFVSDADKRLFAQVRAAAPAALAGFAGHFQDARLVELLFRHQARNWPESLDEAQRARWNDYRRARLHSDAGLSEYSFETYAATLAELRAKHAEQGPVQVLLDALEDWARFIHSGLQE